MNLIPPLQLCIATGALAGNPLSSPIAGEFGVLLLCLTAGVAVGFMLPRVLRAMRLLMLLLVAILLLAWMSGITVEISQLPTFDLLGLLQKVCLAWTSNATWTPLRAGVGAVGFVAGLCVDLRSRRVA